MSSSDVLSSPNLTLAAGTVRKGLHLKLVGKAGKGDSDKSDDAQGAKAKTKGQVDAKTNAKTQDKGSAPAIVQEQFASLLQQVETKLTQKPASSGADETTADDTDSEDADGADTGSAEVKNQNGTTALFAAAYMMRGWEPALIAKADTSATADVEEEVPVAANGNRTAVGLKVPDRKADITAMRDDGIQPDLAGASEVKSAKPQANDVPAPPVKVEPRNNDVAEVAAPQILASAAVKAEARTQSPSPTTVQDPEVKSDIKLLADAQASGVVSSIHVAQVREEDGDADQDTDNGKDDSRKDQPTVAKTETTQASVKTETVLATAAAASSTEAASPVSQVVERILQELPTQNISATADQAAIANKVLTVRLSPEGLGNVLVKISNAGGTMKISLSSDQKATSDQLKSDSSQLLQALQQVMPSFSSDSLSFSTQDQGNGNAQNNAGTGQNAMGGNANSGQWNEGQNYAEQGNRQVPGRAYGGSDQSAGEADAAADTRRSQRAGSIYL